MSLPADVPAGDALGVLSRFRVEFYECLYTRAAVLFELTDAVLCAEGPVRTLVELSLAAEHRRGHGALYRGLDRGWVEPARLRKALAGLPLPRAADGRIVPAVDVSNWLRPDAPTSDERLFCHVYGRGDRSRDQFVPGWPYSFVAALETGRTSWVALLDAVRLGPADDATAVTALQLRGVVERLLRACHWEPGNPEILIAMDSGYDVAHLSHALADLPVVLLGRLRSDHVVLRDPGPDRRGPKGERPRRHGQPGDLPSPARRPAAGAVPLPTPTGSSATGRGPGARRWRRAAGPGRAGRRAGQTGRAAVTGRAAGRRAARRRPAPMRPESSSAAPRTTVSRISSAVRPKQPSRSSSAVRSSA
ncbi:transposase [Kitasatospora phosalacinea]|uniref:transposase n=1 Tax=Kitasatospora phosalacinea TaxID=2065 RepID=UPI003668410B